MTVVSGVAIFIVVWWIVLFAVLPWGVRSPHDEGKEVGPFEDPGAPIRPRLAIKFAVTTAISLVAMALFWAAIRLGWISLF